MVDLLRSGPGDSGRKLGRRGASFGCFAGRSGDRLPSPAGLGDGAGLTVVAFVVPSTPIALRWPLEGGMLLVWIACGGLFWVMGRGYREGISEEARQRRILQRELRRSSCGPV